MKRFKLKNLDKHSEHVILTLEPENQQDNIDFTPGQYIAIGFENGRRYSPMRCFSIASSPYEGNIQIAMRATGAYTRKLTRLIKDSTLLIQGPFGEFTVKPECKNIVMLAAGVGITPFMSIIKQLTRDASPTNIYLIYASRHNNDVPFLDELKKLSASNPRLKVLHIVDKGQNNPAENIFIGRIDENLINRITNGSYGGRQWMLCGPPKFMSDITKILKNNAVDDSHIQSESFQQGSIFEQGATYKSAINTYAITFLVLVVGIVGVALKDLSHYFEKISKSQAPSIQPVNTPATQNSPANYQSDDEQENRGGDDNYNQNSNYSQYSAPATTTQTTTQTYQAPSTKVS